MSAFAKFAPLPESEFKALLKDYGLKATPQRLAVHAAMSELGHASADMVAGLLAKDNTVKITVASVYNVLTQLAAVGIYTCLPSCNNKMYFDVNSVNHIHLYDTVNHEFRDVMDDGTLEDVERKLRATKIRGYKVDSVVVQINCHPSRNKKKNITQ